MAEAELRVCMDNGKVVCVEKIQDDTSIQQYIQYKCAASGRENTDDPFMVVDVGRLFSLHAKWEEALPKICPFYAVKCNEDKLLLKTLAALGTGFDCASKAEIQTILDMGVSPDRIIYANPCKQISHIQYAAKKGVELMTFDNEEELHKVKKHFPTAKLVIRIRADDPNALCQLGMKYGCSVPVGKELLDTALSLELLVVGVCFHVGSGCQTPLAYQSALKLSSEMFQYAASIGYNFTLLDIGGGYPGHHGSEELFNEVAASINQGIDTHFAQENYPNLSVIAEPGRYYVCSTHAIAVNVIGKRFEKGEGPGEESCYAYHVNDGVFGSFQDLSRLGIIPPPAPLKDSPSCPHYRTTVYGPTCSPAGEDKISVAFMPQQDVGDWIYFKDMGAYTLTMFSSFNYFAKPASYYFIRESDSDKFEAATCNMVDHRDVTKQDDRDNC